MIQGSFCSKLNALSYDVYLVLLFLIFRWKSKILPEWYEYFRRNCQKEFQIPSVDRADQVLTLHKSVFLFFLLLSEVMIF